MSEKNNWQQVFPLVSKHGVREEGTPNSSILDNLVICREVSRQNIVIFITHHLRFLLTAPSNIVSDMIHNLDRSVGFIPLDLLTSVTKTYEIIA